MTDFQDMATYLRTVREARGIKQIALASEIGVSDSTLGMWELGDRQPLIKNFLRWCDALGISVEIVLTLQKVA